MNELLRAIPKVTELYDLPEVSDLREHYASSSVTEWIRTVLEQLRSAILSGEVTTLPTLEELGDRICRVAARESLPSLRPVINATGAWSPTVSALAGLRLPNQPYRHASGPRSPVRPAARSTARSGREPNRARQAQQTQRTGRKRDSASPGRKPYAMWRGRTAPRTPRRE